MARRRRSERVSEYDVSNADTTATANDPLQSLLETPLFSLPSSDLSVITPVSRIDEFLVPRLPYDAREWAPEPTREIFELDVGRGPAGGSVPKTVRFSTPETVGVCIRRKVRKEVMIASGRSSRRRRRRKWHSNIRC